MKQEVMQTPEGWVSSAKVSLQASPVAGFSREKLEKMFTDSIRKLKAKDRLVENLTAERDELSAKLREGEGLAGAGAVAEDEREELASQLKACLCRRFSRTLPYTQGVLDSRPVCPRK